jgi:hypothetical protein
MNWRKDMTGVNEENEREWPTTTDTVAATNVAVLNRTDAESSLADFAI